MKKLLLLVMFVGLGFSNVNAQDDDTKSKTSKFGVKAGYSSFGLKVKVEGQSESESVSGFYLGVFGEFKISDKFDLQPELIYSSYSDDGESSGILHVPIMVKYNIDERFAVLFGPQLDYLLEKDDAEGLNRLGVGLAAGLEFDITDEIFLDARYSFGLVDRLKDDLPGFEIFDIKTYFNYLHVGLGYRF